MRISTQKNEEPKSKTLTIFLVKNNHLVIKLPGQR